MTGGRYPKGKGNRIERKQHRSDGGALAPCRRYHSKLELRP